MGAERAGAVAAEHGCGTGGVVVLLCVGMGGMKDGMDVGDFLTDAVSAMVWRLVGLR